MSVPEYRDCFAAECLVNETRQHHSVAPGLSRTRSVEQASDNYPQVLSMMVGQRQEFIDRFGASVTPPTLSGGPVNCIIIFGKWVFGAFSVDLGCRCQQA